ncbi:hypothetical protein ACTXT7_010403 [Hymenolepis weldensis]
MVWTCRVVTDLSSRNMGKCSYELSSSSSVEIKEQITDIVESTKRLSGSPKRSPVTGGGHKQVEVQIKYILSFKTFSFEARAIITDKTLSVTMFSTPSESSNGSNATATTTNSSLSSKVVLKSVKDRQRCLSESVAAPSTQTPAVQQKTNISPKSHKFFGRLRLFSLSGTERQPNDNFLLQINTQSSIKITKNEGQFSGCDANLLSVSFPL